MLLFGNAWDPTSIKLAARVQWRQIIATLTTAGFFTNLALSSLFIQKTEIADFVPNSCIFERKCIDLSIRTAVMWVTDFENVLYCNTGLLCNRGVTWHTHHVFITPSIVREKIKLVATLTRDS